MRAALQTGTSFSLSSSNECVPAGASSQYSMKTSLGPGEDALDQVLGGRALEAERPKHYVAQSTVGPPGMR